MPATGIPLMLDLSGRQVVVVGGGPVAEAKVTSLLDGAVPPPRIRLVAPDVTDRLAEMAHTGQLDWRRGVYSSEDLDGAWLAVAATSSAAVNAAVADDAEQRRLWCIRVDDARESAAALLAAVRHGPLLLAVSTSGTSPALAARIRADLAARYGPEWGQLASLLGELRDDPAVQAALSRLTPDARRRRWHAVMDLDIVSMIRSGLRHKAREVATACLCSSSD